VQQLVTLFDVFVSHASEDKDSFVRPLAVRLEEEHIYTWYDEFSLKLGDNLRRSIDFGLSRSRYGIVVLSHAFFAKEWPQRELDGLVARQTSGGQMMILPIWHGVTKADVCSYAPTVADLFAVDSSRGLDHVISEILKVVRPAGSPLIIARDALIGKGLSPPVVTDQWWLEVVRASNRSNPWGFVIDSGVWDRWSFPLPSGDLPSDQGLCLAYTAMQMQWTEAAEAQRICQILHPEKVLKFISDNPGLAETCHSFPHFLAAYAPQLTIPSYGGEFETDFDDILDHSIRNRSTSGSGLTTTGNPPLCEIEIALRHSSCGDYKPAMVACQFVQGDIGGPPCRLYPHFDYVIWLLSVDSAWLPSGIRSTLLQGMKEWAMWLWLEYWSVEELALGFKEYSGMGALSNALYTRKVRKSSGLKGAELEDVRSRVAISKSLLALPETVEQLVDQFIAKDFVGEYIKANARRQRHKS
jgi:hypothetical protein